MVAQRRFVEAERLYVVFPDSYDKGRPLSHPLRPLYSYPSQPSSPLSLSENHTWRFELF